MNGMSVVGFCYVNPEVQAMGCAQIKHSIYSRIFLGVSCFFSMSGKGMLMSSSLCYDIGHVQAYTEKHLVDEHPKGEE